MNSLEFSLVVGLFGAAAGFLGALTGLGGGVVITPVLTLLFGVDIRYAVGATLVSVIATSSGAVSAFLKEGFSNIRIGMFLEIATTLGAVAGAFLATRVPTSALGVILGIVLLYSAFLSFRPKHEGVNVDADKKTLTPEDFAKVMDLLKLRPMQFCIFLKALVGAEEMQRMMVEAISVAKQV